MAVAQGEQLLCACKAIKTVSAGPDQSIMFRKWPSVLTDALHAGRQAAGKPAAPGGRMRQGVSKATRVFARLSLSRRSPQPVAVSAVCVTPCPYPEP